MKLLFYLNGGEKSLDTICMICYDHLVGRFLKKRGNKMTRARAIAQAKRQADETYETRWVVLDPDPEKDETEKNGYHVVDIIAIATTYEGQGKYIVFCTDDEE